MNQIFLVERFWEQAVGIKSSWGYEPAGYVLKEEDARQMLREKITGTGWPIAKGHQMPKYKLTRLYPMVQPKPTGEVNT
jgi:hypothetical protein